LEIPNHPELRENRRRLPSERQPRHPRAAPGEMPTERLNARLNAASDS
jgi:hypothetical protein